MVLFRYFATFLPALSAVLAFEYLFFSPSALFFLIIGWVVVVFFVGLFLGKAEAWTFSFWQFVIPPLTIFLSAILYSLFLENALLRHAVALLVSLYIAVVFWSMYVYLYQPLRYQANSLEHLSHVCNLFTMFFATVSLFGFRLFLGLPAWVLAFGIFALSALLIEQSFWVSKLKPRDTMPYVFVFPFLLTELAVAVMGLPVTSVVSGAAVTLAYYAFLGLSRTVLRGTYTKAVGQRYAIISLIGICLLFVTARWS